MDALALNPYLGSLCVYLRTTAFVQASLGRITVATVIIPVGSTRLPEPADSSSPFAIGMVVGQIIVAVWLRLRRKSNTTVAYAPVATEEKEGLPKYEDLDDAKAVMDEKV
ncbi:MAG: hypothetical protein Q9194_001062 [Teloschistes cf. exilis]